MKATDLMIGDWVYNKHHKKNIQIKPYDFFVHGHGNNGAFVVSSTIVSGRDFEPIPLTEEILLKNRFALDKTFAVIGTKVYTRPCPAGDLSVKVFHDGSIRFGFIKLTYVHTLQHLLRLCGIEKEIEL